MTWDFVDTEAWAAAQDAVMAKQQPGRTDAWALNKFKAMCEAMELLQPNNLTIRQKVIQAALCDRPDNLDRAWKDFQGLVRNGYFMEGFSYFLYVKAAFDFYQRLTLRLPLQYETALERMYDDFGLLAGPDGNLALSETRVPTPFVAEFAAAGPLPDSALSFSSHTIIDRKGSCLIVEHEVGVRDFPWDFHINPSFGHFAFYSKGNGWIAICPPYRGYADKQARPNAEAAYLNVPRGPWNDEGWRLDGGPFEVLEASTTRIHLRYGKKWFFGLLGKVCDRVFDIDADSVTVTDTGDGCTNLLTSTERNVLGNWTRTTEGAFARWRANGKSRSVRLVF